MIKKLAGQTAIYGLSSMVARLLNYFLVPLHTAYLSQAEYGINTDMYAWVSFLNIVFIFGLETAFFRFGALAENRKKTFDAGVSFLAVSTLLFTCSLWFFSDSIASWMQYPGRENYIKWFALILAFDTMAALPFAKLRLEQRPIKFVSIKVVNILINISLNLFFFLIVQKSNASWALTIKSWLPGNSMVGYIFLANLIANGSTLLLLIGEFKSIVFKIDKAFTKQLVFYGLPLMIAGFAGMINEMLDRILLKFYLPLPTIEALAQTGIYGAVYKLAVLMALFTQTFRMAAEPFFFEQAKQKNAKLIYSRMMNWFVAAGSIVVVFVLIFIDVFKGFIDEKFWSGLPAVGPLIFSYLFLGIYYNLSIWYKLSDNTRWGMYFAFIGVGITVLGNILTIPVYGYMGSAYTTLVCYFVIAILCYIIGQRKFSVPYQVGKITIYIVGAFFTWEFQDQLLYFGLINNPFWAYGIKIAIFLSFTFAILATEYIQFFKEKTILESDES